VRADHSRACHATATHETGLLYSSFFTI